MTDNQLIDALRDCEKYEFCSDCPHNDYCEGAYDICREASNRIETLIAENKSQKDYIALLKHQIKALESESRHEWRNVKADPPKTDGSYIICTDNYAVCTARYYASKKGRKRDYFTGAAGRHAKHWLPLPEPPEDER